MPAAQTCILSNIVIALDSENRAVAFDRPPVKAFIDLQEGYTSIWDGSYLTIKTNDEERDFELSRWHSLEQSAMLKQYVKDLVEKDYLQRMSYMF